MELLTNLTDISHDKQKTVYAKELLAEAEKNRNDYYKEVAYTELICYFIKESTLDSILFYRKEAEKRLTNNDYKQALLSYAKMLYDSKAIMYANSKQQKKILENVYFRLETDKNMSIPERIAANQTIGIYLTKIPEFEENGKKTQDARKYFLEALSLGKNLELRERGLMMPYILYMSVATTSAMPKLQAQYCKQYYQTMIDWLNLPEMKRRPYYTREHLIHAASGMAVTAPVFGKKIAIEYYEKFKKLIQEYPEDCYFSPEYEYLLTSINYYGSIGEIEKELPLLDRIIDLMGRSKMASQRTYYMNEKIEILKQLGRYKEALESYEQYSAALDSNQVAEMNAKVQSLDIQKNVNKLVNEKKALEIKAANRATLNYILGICFIFGIAIFLFVFFRLIRQRTLARALRESNLKLSEANKKVKDTEEMKTSFIRNMSHEVRTPLNAINGFSELVTDEDITAEDRNNFSKIIHENCFQLTTILDELLEVAQLDSSKQEIPFSPINLYDVCSAELANLMKFEKKENVVYSVKGDTENALIETNKPYLGIVLNQLLMNAGKFTNEGFITIGYTIDKNNAQAEIYVADSGSGIPSEKRDWVFERFTKGSEFKKGTGIGLYLCRQIVTRLNGIISVDPNYTGGTRLVITLPTKQHSSTPKEAS
jgi:signal transduction histidine kinase